MTEYIKKMKGEMSIASLFAIGISIIIPVVSGYFLQSQRTDEKISAISERAARLEEAVSTIKADNALTRGKIDELILQLNKRK